MGKEKGVEELRCSFVDSSSRAAGAGSTSIASGSDTIQAYEEDIQAYEEVLLVGLYRIRQLLGLLVRLHRSSSFRIDP